MAKAVIAKTFARAVVGGRRYSRGPTDVIVPTVPVLADPVTGDTVIDIAWTHGVDAETGIKETLIEIRPDGGSLWTQAIVAYPLSAYRFTGLTASTLYDIRVANRDNAGNVSSYSAIKTVATTGSSANLEPGVISIAVPSITAVEGQSIRVDVTRTGSGASSPVVEADWQYTGFSEGTPSPANGTLQWASGENGSQFTAGTAGLVSDQRIGTFRIAAVRALSGTIQPTLGASQISVTIREAPTSGKKWHPAHLHKNEVQPGSSGWLTSTLAALNTHVAGSSVFQGSEIDIMWAEFEPTNGAWNFSALDTLIAWAETNNKRLLIQVADKRFNSLNRNGIIPVDLMAAHLITATAANGSSQSVGAKWRAAYMDRFIRFWEEFASRYDSEPRIEMVSPEECSVGLSFSAPPAGAEDMTREAITTQLIRLYQANGLAWQRTVWSANINSLSGFINTLMEAAYQAGCGWCSPDAVDTAGCRVFRGLTAGSGNEPSPPRDYRGLMAAASIASSPVLGGKDDNGPPSNVINWAQTQSLTHLSWVLSKPSPNTKAQILSAIAADPNLYTACPSVFSSCDVN